MKPDCGQKHFGDHPLRRLCRLGKSTPLGRNVDINWLDLGFALVMLLFVVRGLLNGLMREVAGLAGVLLGFFMAGRWYTVLAPKLSRFVGNPDTAGMVAYGLIFVGVLVGVVIVASLLRKAMQVTFTAWLDHLCGGAVGAAKGFLICALGLALMHKLVPESGLLKTSLLAPHVDEAVTFARSLLPAFI